MQIWIKFPDIYIRIYIYFFFHFKIALKTLQVNFITYLYLETMRSIKYRIRFSISSLLIQYYTKKKLENVLLLLHHSNVSEKRIKERRPYQREKCKWIIFANPIRFVNLRIFLARISIVKYRSLFSCTHGRDNPRKIFDSSLAKIRKGRVVSRANATRINVQRATAVSLTGRERQEEKERKRENSVSLVGRNNRSILHVM